jgi:hypothetical protein
MSHFMSRKDSKQQSSSGSEVSFKERVVLKAIESKNILRFPVSGTRYAVAQIGNSVRHVGFKKKEIKPKTLAEKTQCFFGKKSFELEPVYSKGGITFVRITPKSNVTRAFRRTRVARRNLIEAQQMFSALRDGGALNAA